MMNSKTKTIKEVKIVWKMDNSILKKRMTLVTRNNVGYVDKLVMLFVVIRVPKSIILNV